MSHRRPTPTSVSKLVVCLLGYCLEIFARTNTRSHYYIPVTILLLSASVLVLPVTRSVLVLMHFRFTSMVHNFQVRAVSLEKVSCATACQCSSRILLYIRRICAIFLASGFGPRGAATGQFCVSACFASDLKLVDSCKGRKSWAVVAGVHCQRPLLQCQFKTFENLRSYCVCISRTPTFQNNTVPFEQPTQKYPK